MRQGIPQDGSKLRDDGKLRITQRQSKKLDYRNRTTTRSTPSRAGGEETVGTTIITRQTYRRRREDLGGIGDKVRQKNRVEK
jgi:hypothetical protein